MKTMATAPSLERSPAWTRAARFGLAAKVLAHLVWGGLSLSLLLIGVASYQQYKTLGQEMEKRAALLAESLSGACSLRYLLGDMEAIRHVFFRARQIQDVASIALIAKDGRVETGVGDAPRVRFEADLAEARAARVWKREGAIHVAAPLWTLGEPEAAVGALSGPGPRSGAGAPQLLGHVYLSMSLARTQASLRSLVLRSMTTTLVIILLGSAAAFVFFRRAVLRPIRSLIEGMTAVQQGNLEMSLDGIGRKDEIGALTRTFNDMTRNLRLAEDALRRANADLESRVRERTRDLQDALERLQESQNKVIRSEKLAAIGQLASGVGHELRNPLGAIRNAVYYVRDALRDSRAAQDDPAIVEFLELADKEIRSSTAIIGDLLDFARVIKLHPQPTELKGLIGDCAAAVEAPAGVGLELQLDDGLPPLEADPMRLKQVFVNLMINAYQAMPKGGRLVVRGRLEADGGEPWAAVDFADTGPGILPETLQKIFEPLFTTKAKGTGLGLAISQGIVEAHGGNILVKSEVGRGTTFTVRLPLQARCKA